MFTPLFCCAFAFLGYATIPQFHHSFFFPVLYSEYKIFAFSSLDIFFFTTVFFLPYFTYSTLFSLLLSLHFHAPRYLLYHTFYNCFLEINPCPQFSSDLVPLYSYPPYSTNFLLVLCFLGACPICCYVPVSFPMGNVLAFLSSTVPFVA